jgi:hypothetical protein
MLFGSPFFKKLYEKLVEDKIQIIWYSRIDKKTAAHVCIQNTDGGEDKATAAIRKTVTAAYIDEANRQKAAGYHGGQTSGSTLVKLVLPSKLKDITNPIFEACKVGKKMDALDWAKYYIGTEKRW